MPRAEPRDKLQTPTAALDAGEVGIYQSRLEQQNSALAGELQAMTATTNQLHTQLRELADGSGTVSPGRGNDGVAQLLARGLTTLADQQATMGERIQRNQALLLQLARASRHQELPADGAVPFASRISQLENAVAEAARTHHRDVRLQCAGTEVEVDTDMLEAMMDPLEDLLRNMVAESAEANPERGDPGTPEYATIDMQVSRIGGQLTVVVRDDGSMLDLARIRAQAKRQGLIAADTEFTDADCAQLIFRPDWASTDGVPGMAAVGTKIKQLGGCIRAESEPGHGKLFRVRLPLRPTTIKTVLVHTGDERYAIPLTSIVGVTRVARTRISSSTETPDLDYDGETYRVHDLGQLLDASGRGQPGEHPARAPVLLVHCGGPRIALVVDELGGARDLEARALAPPMANIAGLAGAAILDSGDVVLIVDIAALAPTPPNHQTRQSAAEPTIEAAGPP